MPGHDGARDLAGHDAEPVTGLAAESTATRDHRADRLCAHQLAALGALGSCGAAIAGAADTARPRDQAPTRRRGRSAMRGPASRRQVNAAALEKAPARPSPSLRTEAGGPTTRPTTPTSRSSDGTRKVELVRAAFGHGGPGRPGSRRPAAGRGHRGRPRAGETALTGETKHKVGRPTRHAPARRSCAPRPTATRARPTSRTSRRAPARSSRSS